MSIVHQENVVHFTSLCDVVEQGIGNLDADWGPLNRMVDDLNGGDDKDYSPETWEQQLNLLSVSGLVAKMKQWGVSEPTLQAFQKKLEEYRNPWVALSL